jgi:hypothetical protein
MTSHEAKMKEHRVSFKKIKTQSSILRSSVNGRPQFPLLLTDKSTLFQQILQPLPTDFYKAINLQTYSSDI